MSLNGGKGGKQSRFSTLRVFGKLGRNAAPPPPPKDPMYLAAQRNRSLASLSPDSMPGSPSPSPLAGEQYAASSSSAVSLTPSQSQKSQRSGLFKFGTLRRASPTSTTDGMPSPGGAGAEDADEGISMPWNFQHNVHVDEGFVGLPPSWTTSLQDAGFSEDEIARIQQRKMTVDRIPTDRANSPPSLVKPVPRSTSLPKNQQGHTPASSLSASSASTRSSPSPVPYAYGSPKIEYASPKVDYATAPKLDIPPSKPQLQMMNPSPISPPPMYEQPPPLPLNISRRKPAPPSREESRSPPPRSYSPALSARSQQQPQAHSRSGSQHSSAHSHSDFFDDEDEDHEDEDEQPPPAAAPGSTKINAKNLTLALDLSIGGDTWSNDVLSATSLKPAFAPSELTSTPNNNNLSANNSLTATGGAPGKSPTSPLFTLTAPGRPEEEFSPTEAYSYDQYYDDLAQDAGASPLGSPTSPLYAEDGDGDLLPPNLNLGLGQRERDNRDSGMSDATMLPPTPLGPTSRLSGGTARSSTSSGMTQRPPSTGVVSRIAVARRAVAEVVGVPAVPRGPPPPVPTQSTLQPPASPQSSNFGSSGSGSSESQDHQTPTTEMEAEDEDDTGELDYYLEGKNYLEKHGFKLEGGHRPRGDGQGHTRTDSRKNDEYARPDSRKQGEFDAVRTGTGADPCAAVGGEAEAECGEGGGGADAGDGGADAGGGGAEAGGGGGGAEAEGVGGDAEGGG
ncbi:hypothetical protein C8R45DRAFT_521067 [Mycena sanguinolenta]|nr:hypothetical protein C8R45DRAFT_521067 [Mycena sanguinolenta]